MTQEYQQLVSDFKRHLMQMKNSSAYVSCNTIIKKSAPLSSPNLVLPAKELKVAAPIALFAAPKVEKQAPVLPAPIEHVPVVKAPVPSQIDHFVDLKAMMKKLAPSLKVYEEPISDAKAIEVKNDWNIKLPIPVVPILMFSESKEMQAFLQQVAKAIDNTFVSSKALSISQIEKKMKIEEFLDKNQMKLILVSRQTLHAVKPLLIRYKETGSSKNCFIHDIQTIILEDISVYFSNPLEKKKLWHEICKYLSVKK